MNKPRTKKELPWNSLSNNEVRTILQSISRANKLTTSIETYQKLLIKLKKLNLEIALGYNFGRLYRAQIGIKDTIKEVWYKPLDIKGRIGRCNCEDESLFYCSLDSITPIIELRPQKGDFVTLITCAQIKNSESINTFSFGRSLIKDYGLPFIRITSNDKKAAKRLQMVDEFIASEFRKVVIPGENHNYKITAGYSQLFLKQDHIHAVTFPSIATNYIGTNLAIKPKIIDDSHHVIEARVFEITEIFDDFDLIAKCRFISTKIHENGVIDWGKIKCDGHEMNAVAFINHK